MDIDTSSPLHIWDAAAEQKPPAFLRITYADGKEARRMAKRLFSFRIAVQRKNWRDGIKLGSDYDRYTVLQEGPTLMIKHTSLIQAGKAEVVEA